MKAEQIAEALGLTRTTCYRYTRELSQAGLLVSKDGLFMLGPRIIELDRKIIDSDPLLNAGQATAAALAESLGAIGLLSTFYDSRVINIFQHVGPTSPPVKLFGRGSVMPLFRSSTSKVLLSTLNRSRLRRIWLQHQEEPDCTALGSDWLSFWRAIQAVRQQGYWTSVGEMHEGFIGISVPIYFREDDPAGCLTLVFTSDEFNVYGEDLLSARLRAGALQIAKRLPGELRGECDTALPIVQAKSTGRRLSVP